MALDDLGGYATWDAGLTLGHVPGPIQVQAQMATDATGSGLYAGPWVTVTVNPDAGHAATSGLGPGSVNLLTGDYRMSSTDVSMFGLSLERTTSSRDPRAGLELQDELLTESQQKMSALTEVYGRAATVAVDATRWHTENNSLKVTPAGTSPDSYAYPGPQSVGDIGMEAGRTYRVTGWIHVPTATGLDPDDARGLRIVGFYTDSSGTHQGGSSAKATVTGTWEELSFDLTVPAGATNAFIRLYNGFQATNRPVYFDDLSVREVWAPLGPQWQLGTSNEVTSSPFTHLDQPYANVVAVHLSGGGEVWFTGSASNSVWSPQRGAESLTLTRLDQSSWRLTQANGTTNLFTRHHTNAQRFELVSASPAVAAGQVRLVYEIEPNTDRLRLTRMIAPVEPGVDDWPTNQNACLGPVYAVGCRVLELVYATTTSATATGWGSFSGQLRSVRLHSSDDGAAVTGVEVVRYGYDDAGRLREVYDPRVTPALKTSYDYDADGRVIELAPPGELPWTFRYGTGGATSEVGLGDLVDRSSGRLYSVSRASLVPGTVDQTGPDTTSTVVYAVPLTRAAGGPYDLDPVSLATLGAVHRPDRCDGDLRTRRRSRPDHGHILRTRAGRLRSCRRALPGLLRAGSEHRRPGRPGHPRGGLPRHRRVRPVRQRRPLPLRRQPSPRARAAAHGRLGPACPQSDGSRHGNAGAGVVVLLRVRTGRVGVEAHPGTAGAPRDRQRPGQRAVGARPHHVCV